MSKFAIFHPRNERSLPQERNPGFVVRLFVIDVPATVDATMIERELKTAGRDPALMDLSTSTLQIASEADWPSSVKIEWKSTGIERITWEGLQEEAKGWRRITIRVSPEIYAMAQSEAKRRQQSITQFCVGAIKMQVGIRSYRVELELFCYFRSGGYSEKTRSASLPALQQYVAASIPDCTHEEIVAALKRLHPNHLKLDKWIDGVIGAGFKPYSGDDNMFFHRGEFRMEITAEGRPYSEALKATLTSAGQKA